MHRYLAGGSRVCYVAQSSFYDTAMNARKGASKDEPAICIALHAVAGAPPWRRRGFTSIPHCEGQSLDVLPGLQQANDLLLRGGGHLPHHRDSCV